MLVQAAAAAAAAAVMSMVGGDRKNRAATNLRKFHYGLVSSDPHLIFIPLFPVS